MPHLHRFFVPSLEGASDAAVLTEQEAHHALHVVRARVGDQVALFDGHGREWDGVVANLSRHEVSISLGALREVPRPAVRLTLLQSWLHREKAVEELIRHGAEIGVSRFVFFSAHHSERKPQFSEKWRRTAVEACKQCGRLWLPEFEVADDFESALARVDGTLLLATKDLPPVTLREAITTPEVSLIVGPEGDFTERELTVAVERGAKPISLGEVTYRAEVAAMVAATVILYELGMIQVRNGVRF